MGNYNTLRTEIHCPRCGVLADVEIELRFGETARPSEFVIGDRYPWAPRKTTKNGGRPEGGNLDGEGYMECPACRKDSFVSVTIRDDIVMAAGNVSARPGYIAD